MTRINKTTTMCDYCLEETIGILPITENYDTSRRDFCCRECKKKWEKEFLI